MCWEGPQLELLVFIEHLLCIRDSCELVRRHLPLMTEMGASLVRQDLQPVPGGWGGVGGGLP